MLRYFSLCAVLVGLMGPASGQEGGWVACLDRKRVNTMSVGLVNAGSMSDRWQEARQDRIYRIKKNTDIPIVAGAAAWDIYGFTQIAKKSDASLATVEALKTTDINWFDRWAVRPYNRSVDKLSYVPFYVAIPSPMLLFAIDPAMRKDFWQLTFLYGEAMIVTGAFYTSAVHYVSRYRPLVYSSESPMNVRTQSNSKNSFFAGHVALVGTSMFFMARTWTDYHPDSRLKWLVYGGAGAITALTGYWRHRAGEHFPSDILLGAAIGTCSGLLTPVLHRVKLLRNSRLSILPFGGLKQGLAMSGRGASGSYMSGPCMTDRGVTDRGVMDRGVSGRGVSGHGPGQGLSMFYRW